MAYLAARSRDVAGAEDALSDALQEALRCWPRDGVPKQPEAWLLHVARNRLIDAARHALVRNKYEPMLQLTASAEECASLQSTFPDERLKLLFVCAHPAIDPQMRTPLMLQTVLGLDAARVASAFLVSPAAMDKRLLRAKTKIREAGVPFIVPETPELAERFSFVLDAIYAAFSAGWEAAADMDSARQDLAREAIQLGQMLVQLLPAEPEALGLLALMLHCEARRCARRTSGGEFIPLDRQDPTQWSRATIAEAEKFLRQAAKLKRVGRYQLEAAIQSIHAHRAESGVIDWRQIALLYEGLVRLAPTAGALVGRAVAMAECGDVAGALAALESMDVASTEKYQSWWAARAHLLRRSGRAEEARNAFERAASLSEDAAIRAYLLKRAAD